jgi:methylenetetrahydrofolate--tRNA-(uracil-5-)-methyltransferase
MIHIIGGGLAGSEAAWQAATLGVPVVLHEMRPVRPTAVHKTDRLAELVCSNSLRGDKLDNAVGLLKEEMRRLGSLVMRAADAHRVPAGAALAVDREHFSQAITEAIHSHPLITLTRGEITRIPDDPSMFPLIVATGPLTSEALSADVAALVGGDHLYFYDAISPIVLAETIDMNTVFRASRWGRSLRGHEPSQPEVAGGLQASAACGVDDGEGDYLNCPMTRDEYERFYEAVIGAESATVQRLRQGEVLRRLPADRSDGASRPRDTAVRADEAGGTR